jgi:dTDP-4-dehydrorhamnose reductase
MSKRILLTGKTGQVGAELAKFLPRLGAVIAFDRQQLDLSQPDHICRAIREVRPQIIVNAAAYTAVDQAETDEAAARAINADAPGILAEEAKKIGAGLVHYSTDYVFDGLKTSPYEENDPLHPLSVYGRTKLAGEQAIREAGVSHLIFRTEWVYGTRGRNFLLTILRLMTQREELKVVHDQAGAPTWCREIARATTSILERHSGQGSNALPFEAVCGTYHMTASGVTTWYEFAQAILEEASQAPQDIPWLASATSERPLVVRRIVPITTAEYPTPARRPAYSVLSNSRLRDLLGFQLPPWRSQLHSAFRSEDLSAGLPAGSVH